MELTTLATITLATQITLTTIYIMIADKIQTPNPQKINPWQFQNTTPNFTHYKTK